MKWQKRKEEKDRENIAKQLVNNISQPTMRPRSGSYTELKPTFAVNLLPKIAIETSDSDKETVVDGPASMQSFTSVVDESAADKSSKDLKNEIDRRSTAPASPFYESSLVPKVNHQLKDLIEKQKQEYLMAMEALKNKFTSEQHDLLMNIQSNLVTSTPLDNSCVPCSEDEDEEFTEFKTCLRSQSISLGDKTMVNDDQDAKVSFNIQFQTFLSLSVVFLQMKASTVINAYVRGYLTRRLIGTIYVQEHIRNIKETLQLVLNLDDHHIGGSPVQNILLKAKLFRQLQSDLYNFNEIFFKYSIKENMKIISADREIRLKKQVEENKENLNLSFHEIV